MLTSESWRLHASWHSNIPLVLQGAKARYKDAGGSIAPLQIVFHGTPETNIDSILRQGLLPERRRSNASYDWFGGSPRNAKPFKKLLVFLVLRIDGAAATARVPPWPENTGVMTLKCANYQLPIGTVELT